MDFCLCINDSSNIFNAKSGRRPPHKFGVSSKVFEDDEFDTEAKTNSKHRVHPLLVRDTLFTCKKHAQGLLFACYTHCAHTPLYVTSPPRVDLNFLTHFTGKGQPSIFKWSALSMRSVDWNV